MLKILINVTGNKEMYKSVGEPLSGWRLYCIRRDCGGMDVLEKIALVATDSNDRPKEDVIILEPS